MALGRRELASPDPKRSPEMSGEYPTSQQLIANPELFAGYQPRSGKAFTFPEFDHSLYPIPDEDWEALGGRAKVILEQLLPEFAGRFAQKSIHYGDANPDNLGPAGQFSDIWRKIGPLRRALWEGKELTQEDPETILFDLIGHCLLTIEMIRRGVERRGDS